MDIYGICADCLKACNREVPLISAKQGEKLVITDLIGGTTLRMRLLTMGLRLGDKLEVITNQNQGQLVIAADAKRYVIGRGMAEKILVQRQGPLQKTKH
jgi:Fur family ferric uptake transcriptional regulator